MTPISVWNAALLFALGDFALLLISADYRGPSFDDFATFYFAEPSVSWGEAWRHLWPTETNPPLFYALARLWRDGAGVTLWARRMINVWPLLAAAFWWSQRFRPASSEQRQFLLIYALGAVSSYYFFKDFTFYRSYFLQYIAAFIFVGAATLNHLQQRRGLDGWQILAIPFLVNLHQVTTLYFGIFLALLLLIDLRARNLRRPLVMGGLALICLIPLLAFIWLQHFEQSAVMNHAAWIKPRSFIEALRAVLGFLPRALGQNWVLIAAGLIGLVGFTAQPAIRFWQRVLGAAITLATLLLLAANEIVPLIVDRYFAFMTVVTIAILALASLRVAERFKWFTPLLLGFAAIYSGAEFNLALRDQGWRQGASRVAQEIAKCPTTHVHAGAFPANEFETAGLAFLAAEFGFITLPADQIERPTQCPVLYWSEISGPLAPNLASWQGDLVRAANASSSWALPEDMLTHASAERTKNGVIIIVTP